MKLGNYILTEMIIGNYILKRWGRVHAYIHGIYYLPNTAPLSPIEA
jgi:hypothetical protein